MIAMSVRGLLIVAMLAVSPALADESSGILSNEPLDTINPHREFQYNDAQPKTEWLVPGLREQQSNGEGCTITGWGRACGPTNGF